MGSFMLDIVVPHYTESWDVVSKFFTMLDLQRGVDFSSFRVTIVNDGEDHHIPDKHFLKKPYQFRQLDISHGGVSAARNAGLRVSDAEWIMFCDCDDMFSNPYALRDFLTVLPAPEFDMLWAELLIEDTRKDGKFVLYNRSKQNCVFTHAKIYRRQFLLDHHMWFNTALTFNEDSEFNAILLTYLDYKRTGKINALTPPYIWCWRKDSTTKCGDRRVEAILCHYQRNKNVVEAHRKNLPYNRYCGMVARTCIDAYYALNIRALPSEMEEMKRDFIAFYLEHKQQWLDTDLETLKQAKEISHAERDWIDLEYDGTENSNYDFTVDESVSVTQWLNQLEKEASNI